MIVERTNVDIRGSETKLLNEVVLDCYWNGGSPKEQNRYYDNFVISTQRIGLAKNPTSINRLQKSETLSKSNLSKMNIKVLSLT